MLAGAKPKKRSRLALPRQKGACSASNGNVLRPKENIQHGPAQGLPPAPTAAGCLGQRDSQAVQTTVGPLVRRRQHPLNAEARSGPHDTATADDTKNFVALHPATSPSNSQEQKTDEPTQEKRSFGCRIGGSDGIRRVLNAVHSNARPEVTSAMAVDAAAMVAAAASEVSRMLDTLESNNNFGVDGGGRGGAEMLRTKPPPPTAPSSGGNYQNESNTNGRTSRARSEGQQQHPTNRKRQRPGSTTITCEASRSLTTFPPSSSSRAPALPSPKRGMTTSPQKPEAKPSSVDSPSQVAAATAAATAAAVAEVVLLDADCELEAKSGSRGEGGGGSGRRTAADQRPPLPTCLEDTGGGPSSCAKDRHRCPVCGSAVWGLSVRARQVHINACLDGVSVRGGEAGAGGSGEGPSGRRPSTEGCIARKPKTEYQEHMQMAKALSKSIVVPAPAPASKDQETDEELARNPAAFRAKERRLVGVVRDLDAKLEHLKKDRDAALRKLAAHRALGARVSAGVGGVPGDNSGDSGRAPMTTDELVDTIFSDEHGPGGAGPLPGSTNNPQTSSEGRRDQRQPSSPSSSSPAGPLPARRKGATAARRHESPEGTPATSIAEGGAGGIFPSGDECVNDNYNNDEEVGDDGTGDDDDDGAGGAARLIRRRSNGGSEFCDKVRKSSTTSGGRGRVRGGRTLWGIAQGADELSQSNFVTGVFADIRAKTLGVAGLVAKGEKMQQDAKPGGRAGSSRVTAAAYGDARLYNRRTRSVDTTRASSATLDTGEGDTDATTRSAPDKGAGGCRRENATSEAGAGEPREFNGDGGDSDCDDDAAALNDAILLLSQTLSAASASGEARKEREAAAKNETDGSARVAARHIARAPVSVLSKFFPHWKENVQFVFRQGAVELRDALQSIAAALSEEETAVAALAAAADRGGALEGGRGGKERRSGGDGDRRRGSCGKAEALLFFQGVIVEALELRESLGSRAARQPSMRKDGSRSGCRSGGPKVDEGRKNRRPGGGGRDVHGCGGGSSGGATSIRNSPRGASTEDFAGESEEGSSRRDECGDVEGKIGDGSKSGDRRAVAGGAIVPAETLDGGAESISNDHDVGPAGDVEMEEVSRSGGHREEDSVETIVLSGDSTASAVVTFDLTSSETSKRCSEAASPAPVAPTTADIPFTDTRSAAAASVESGDYATGEGGRSSRNLDRDPKESAMNAEEEAKEGEGEEEDNEVAIVASGGGGEGSGGVCPAGERGTRNADSDIDSVVDEYALEHGDGFAYDYYPWEDDNEFSALPSPDHGGTANEGFGPSAPLSSTQRPPEIQAHAGAALADKASRDHTTGMGAELLDLTQTAPSPLLSSRPSQSEGSELDGVASPGRSRSQHSDGGISEARLDNHCTASPVRDDKEEAVERTRATASSAGGAGDEDGLWEVMPSFSQMTLQELAGMMAVYGLKKKSKREMTERLEHIWKTLHPGAAAAAAAAAAATAAESGVSPAGGGNTNRKRAKPSGKSVGGSSSLAASQGRRGGAATAAAATAAASTGLLGRRPLARPQEVDRTLPSPRRPQRPSQQRQQEPQRGVGEEGGACLGERIRGVITAYAPLHEDILLLKTVELSATQRLLKDAGVKCSKKDLASYLDARGITFVDRGSGVRKRGGGTGGEARGGEKTPRKKRPRAAGDPSAAATARRSQAL